jgi:hypothetical protein
LVEISVKIVLPSNWLQTFMLCALHCAALPTGDRQTRKGRRLSSRRGRWRRGSRPTWGRGHQLVQGQGQPAAPAAEGLAEAVPGQLEGEGGADRGAQHPLQHLDHLVPHLAGTLHALRASCWHLFGRGILGV